MSAALWQVWAWADVPSDVPTIGPSSSGHSHRRQGLRFASVGSKAVPKGKPPLAFYARPAPEARLHLPHKWVCGRS